MIKVVLIGLLISLTTSCSYIKLREKNDISETIDQPIQAKDAETINKSKDEVKSEKQEPIMAQELEENHQIKEIENFVPPEKVELSQKLQKYCQKINKKFSHYGWGKSHCNHYKWNHVRNSVLGDPLIWLTYGDEEAYLKEDKDMTLIMCAVHGDEITPVRFCFDMIEHLEMNQELYKDKLIVVAPIVNPDSFFKKKPSRTNHHGVDINRNFPTKDWDKDALRLWAHRYKKDKRRYPGKSSKSEPEVVFQVNLIKRYHPDKILSVHAPLTMLDYDGPLHKNSDRSKARAYLANQLLIQMSEKASGYRVKNYPYFPGSLGNWAGKERNIPTYTLELPTSDARYSRDYWNLFKSAMHHALMHDLGGNKQKIAHKEENKASKPN